MRSGGNGCLAGARHPNRRLMALIPSGYSLTTPFHVQYSHHLVTIEMWGIKSSGEPSYDTVALKNASAQAATPASSKAATPASAETAGGSAAWQ